MRKIFNSSESLHFPAVLLKSLNDIFIIKHTLYLYLKTLQAEGV